MIKIHETAKISPKSDIEDSTRGSSIEIGANSTIDSFVKFKPAGGKGDIKIGDRVYINSCCVLYSGNGISIGNDVLISANCTLAPVNHEYTNRSKKISFQGQLRSFAYHVRCAILPLTAFLLFHMSPQDKISLSYDVN